VTSRKTGRKKKNEALIPEEGIALPIEWYTPEGITTIYVTDMAVQHFEHEFILTFWELERPLLLGSAEEIEETLKKLKSVKKVCKARIAVAADRMPAFIEALRTNLKKFQEMKKMSQEGKSDGEEETIQ
jgi:hypothetical protein